MNGQLIMDLSFATLNLVNLVSGRGWTKSIVYHLPAIVSVTKDGESSNALYLYTKRNRRNTAVAMEMSVCLDFIVTIDR